MRSKFVIKKLIIPGVLFVLLGAGCTFSEAPTKEPVTTSATSSRTSAAEDVELAHRAAVTAHYAQDEKFSSFLRSLQPADCKGQTPNVSSVMEEDVPDVGKVLVVDATSCDAGSAGSDMAFVALKSSNGSYTASKIDGHIMAELGAHLTIENGHLVRYMLVSKPEDPACCPTGGADRTLLQWNGAAFVKGEMTHLDAFSWARFESLK